MKSPSEPHQELREENSRLRQEIKELKQSMCRLEEMMKRQYLLDRRLRTIAGAVRAVARAADEAAMLEEACRTIAETGGYRLAWVGYAEKGSEKTVLPAAHGGSEQDYLLTLNMARSDREHGRGPAREAIRTGTTVVVHNLKEDRRRDARGKGALLQRYASLISVPFTFAGGRTGALTVYAAEPYAFDEDERGLIEELARVLAFGVSALRERRERASTEQTLAYRTMLLEAQSETSIDGILAVDDQSRIVFTNRLFTKIWGVPASLLDSGDDAKVLEYCSARTRDPQKFRERVDYLYGHPAEKSRDEIELADGRWLDRYSSPLTGADGKPFGRIWFFRNMSERKRMEAALRQSERDLKGLVKERTGQLRTSESKYRALFENAKDAIFLIWDGSIVDCNAKALEIFGSHTEYFIGLGPEAVFPPLRIDGKPSGRDITEKIRGALSGKPQHFKWQCLRNDGTIFDAEVDLHAVRTGEEMLLQGVVRDISGRTQTERALQESEDRLRTFFSLPIIGFALIGVDGQWVHFNDKLCEMLGYSRSELERKTWMDLTPAEDLEKQRPLHEGMYAGKSQAVNLETSYIRKNGTLLPVFTATRAVRNPDGSTAYFASVIVDISDRKKAEAALKQSEAELRIKSENLGELNIALKVLLQQKARDEKELAERFASNVSQLVLPYVEKMKAGPLDPEQRSRLSIIEANLNEIVSPFLHSIRQLNLTPREAQVASLIREGRTTKEIALILGVGPSAVDTYRNKIRKKLNLINMKANLQSHLQSLA